MPVLFTAGGCGVGRLRQPAPTMYAVGVMPELTPIKTLTRDELLAAFDGLGQPSYRADQVLQWIYQRKTETFDEMSNLPSTLRRTLAMQFELNAVRAVRCRNATDDTIKFLFEMRDQSLIETVLIPATPGLTSQSDRHTVCVSTQVGCAYGCRFCASGLLGVRRNLTTAEIVDQVVHVRNLTGQTVNNIVVMGMGEPLANYDNLLAALRILNASWGMAIGARKITVSTVGLVPAIRRLADEPMQLRLAISLHGATDEVRSQIMPVNRKYPLHDLLAACEYYVKTRRRILTFEYILLRGVNDTPDQARHLAVMARRLRAKVNLIPYNPVEELPWTRPAPDRCRAFQCILEQENVSSTLRTEKGTDIHAACGQLRLQSERYPNETS